MSMVVGSWGVKGTMMWRSQKEYLKDRRLDRIKSREYCRVGRAAENSGKSRHFWRPVHRYSGLSIAMHMIANTFLVVSED